MHWKTTLAVYTRLSPLPFGSTVLLQLQKHVKREVPRRASALYGLLAAARGVLDLCQGHAHVPMVDANFVGIGAGRDLAVALALRLLGGPKTVGVDIARLAGIDPVQHAADHLARALAQSRPLFRNWGDIAGFGIEYRSPEAFNLDNLFTLRSWLVATPMANRLGDSAT
jgi:hypothetical protein